MCASLSHIHASLCLFYVAMGLRRRNRRNLKSEGLMSLARHLKLPRKARKLNASRSMCAGELVLPVKCIVSG